MKILEIKDNKLILDELSLNIDDIITANTYSIAYDLLKDAESIFVNEIFLNWIVKFCAINEFITNTAIGKVIVYGENEQIISFINDTCKIKEIEVSYEKSKSRIFNLGFSSLYFILMSFLSFVYLVCKNTVINKTNSVNIDNDKFAIIRSKQAISKMKFLTDVEMIYEECKYGKCIYSYSNTFLRFKWLIASMLYSCKEYKNISKLLTEITGNAVKTDILRHYAKRIVHTNFYKMNLEYILSFNHNKEFYTGNNLDRFALIEEQLAKKFNVKLICIPHGIEYGFRMPHCFTGDEFYATSLNAKRFLNDLYNTQKFVFDYNTCKKMFNLDYVIKPKSDRQKVVFFTEPREVYINLSIIKSILDNPYFYSKHLYLKLHPKDRVSDYEDVLDRVNIIDDFNDAIADNICVSRKSTILLEAIYNNSSACSILTNRKDEFIFNTFPSLNNKDINVVNSVDELIKWIHVINDNGVDELC